MNRPVRKLPRLRGYDYTSHNYYFVTICTADKQPLFWNRGALSSLGQIAREELLQIPQHYKNVLLDQYVVMPNHIHAILVIGCDMQPGATPSLSTIVGAYKSGVSRRIHQTNPDIRVWQKSFYDSVIRNDQMYGEIWRYISENPVKWELNEHSRNGQAHSLP